MDESTQRVVIIGAGAVGTATGLALRDVGHRVALVELDAARRDDATRLGLATTDRLEPIASNTVVMICVQTPADRTGFDLGPLELAVRSVGAAIAHDAANVIVAIRSTVPPGTCDLACRWLHESNTAATGDAVTIACMPEFLRQVTAVDDARHPRVTVIASPDPRTIETLTELVRPLGGAVHTSTSFVDAEMIKCAHNAFNATKISFWNEMFAIGESFGANATLVAQVVAASAEGSWNPRYGIRGGQPYEGTCLPKDAVGFAAHAAAAGVDPVVLDAVDRRNALMRTDAE